MSLQIKPINNIYIKCVSAYFIVYSILVILWLAYGFIFHDVKESAEYIIVISAFIYLFFTAFVSIKTYYGSTRYLRILKILIILQIFYIHIDNCFFRITNGAELNMYLTFFKNHIIYTFNYSFFTVDTQFRITENNVNYLGFNFIPVLLFFTLRLAKTNPRSSATSA